MTTEQTDKSARTKNSTPSGSLSFPNPSATLFTKRSADLNEGEAIHRPSLSYWKDAWQRIKKNKLAMASAAYVFVLGLAAIFMPMVLDYNHEETEEWAQNLSPNLGQEAVVIGNEVTYIPVRNEAALESESDSFDPPEPPSSVEVMGTPLSSGIAIKWSVVEGADSYLVYRSIDSGTAGIPLEELSADNLSHLDTVQIDSNATYFYSVFSVNSMGESETATSVTVKPKLALSVANALKFDPNATVGQVVLTKPHYLGTDYLGRDMLARVMIGARVSLFIGFGAPLIYILIGVIYGCISGYFGGLMDDIMMRIADVIATIPELLTVIMLQVFLGSGIFTLILALVVAAWARSARQLRGEVLKLREAEFVQAGKVLGTSTPKIILRHLLPNTTGTILVVFTLAIPQAIFTEAFLSFIGLGIKPPMASWGSVTREGAKVWLTYPHELIVPATLISASILAFNLLGDGLRDALDPKLRGTH